MLRCSDILLNRNYSEQFAVMFGIVIAKKLILQLWKAWLNEMISAIQMERIGYELSDVHKKSLLYLGPISWQAT